MSQILLIVSLVLAVLALALSVLIPVIHLRKNKHWDEKELREKVVHIVKDSQRVEKIISEQVQTRVSRMQQPISKDEIVIDVLEQLKPEVQKMVDEMIVKTSKSTVDDKQKVIDATTRRSYGFYGKDSFVLTDSPTDSTIYCFTTDPKDEQKAWFDVFNVNAVTKDKNMLQGCCSIEGKGERLLTLEKGLAICKDGKWVLEKKLKIKFN